MRLGFPSAPNFLFLTLPAVVTRRTVLQKVRGSSHKEVPQLVNTGFQVLFHSPPGVLFTVPSQYYTLSVTEEYLALGGGPPMFPQGFSCLVVLWIPLAGSSFRIRGFHPLRPAFPKPFFYKSPIPYAVRTPVTSHRFGLFPVRSPLLRKSRFLSLPEGTEMFQFPSFPP